ncbi:hypothetical protein JG687_00015952 [Phytophthora cactorum]|uniref:Uncharacterized protein n=2 Tax=Phytophthora cactorum TaxID=29920 RepID=A0A329RDS7_9STRA|nr:hypothetical protein JG687_00015952 [Phytophthora cactorum]RAW22189.1 hypothetical protein PC110_g21370 [Phytophthora cactorum]
MSKLKSVGSKTLKRYMSLLVAAVEAKISAKMSGQFGFVSDASTLFLENYVALFGVYWHDGQLKQALLTIAPMEEGCASHRFNLVVNSYLSSYNTEVDSVSTLMAALRTFNNRAALCEYTLLSLLRPNVTRWSSTVEMVAHYIL